MAEALWENGVSKDNPSVSPSFSQDWLSQLKEVRSQVEAAESLNSEPGSKPGSQSPT
jgi:hypothetical protein